MSAKDEFLRVHERRRCRLNGKPNIPIVANSYFLALNPRFLASNPVPLLSIFLVIIPISSPRFSKRWRGDVRAEVLALRPFMGFPQMERSRLHPYRRSGQRDGGGCGGLSLL